MKNSFPRHQKANINLREITLKRPQRPIVNFQMRISWTKSGPKRKPRQVGRESPPTWKRISPTTPWCPRNSWFLICPRMWIGRRLKSLMNWSSRCSRASINGLTAQNKEESVSQRSSRQKCHICMPSKKKCRWKIIKHSWRPMPCINPSLEGRTSRSSGSHLK